MSGTLYICGLPIGNDDDISQRVLNTLRTVDYIAAEDTRTTSLFLAKFSIKQNYLSFHDFSEAKQITKLVGLLEEGKDIALVSDAGMPLISDPGYELIQRLRQDNLPIICIPGPTAATSALVLSGLPTNCFCFIGFLPRKQKQRETFLKTLLNQEATLIFYEAPHRIVAMLQSVRAILGEREIFIGRELTKKYEEQLYGKISEIIKELASKQSIKGEFAIVVKGADRTAVQARMDYVKLVEILQKEGLPPKQIVTIVSQYTGKAKNSLKQELF